MFLKKPVRINSDRSVWQWIGHWQHIGIHTLGTSPTGPYTKGTVADVTPALWLGELDTIG